MSFWWTASGTVFSVLETNFDGDRFESEGGYPLVKRTSDTMLKYDNVWVKSKNRCVLEICFLNTD